MIEKPHHRTTREAYDSSADAYETRFSTYSPYLEAMRSFLTLVPPLSRVLDIGYGPGILSKLISDHGHKVTGIDASAAMIAKAQSRCPKGKFFVLNVNEIDRIREKFNVIVASFIIVHLDDQETDNLIFSLLDKENSTSTLAS